MRRTGGQLLIDRLLEHDVSTVFGVPGVQLDWAVDALRERQDRIRFIVPRHEQATSYMADGYARATSRPGVCMMVPGPGLLNALSGLATAYACCSPVLCIAGQIDSASIGLGQGRLHEIPGQSAVLDSVTKWHALARSPEEIPGLIDEAFRQMAAGIPRPVCVEVPPDVLQAATGAAFGAVVPPAPTALKADPGQLQRIADRMKAAQRPVILAGRGTARGDGPAALRRLAEALDAAVVTTEGGRGALPDAHPLALSPAAMASLLPLADAVLSVGTRCLSAPGTTRPMADGAWVAHVNLDGAHLRPPRPADEVVLADGPATLAALAGLVAGGRAENGMADLVRRTRAATEARLAGIRPQTEWIQALRSAIPEDGILVSDLTQVGYLANVSYPVGRPDELIAPGYQGTLGFGYATALGAAAGAPGHLVVSISGDGGFAYTLQELVTARRFGLPVVAIVFADGRFGNVHRIQSRVFGQSYAAEIDNPDFALLAAAFGIAHRRIAAPEELASAIAAAEGAPLLVEVPVGEMDTPWPAVLGIGSFAEPPPAEQPD
ncbi:thiamine pyrophosphate-binding protein [Marinibaculum pumilum]|uniref:Thiamine pyrophosphate-binding protein n=1 Tax=Marinibaculum pumilum TaxID=1766165 RepID=A0ABV7KYV0_9PROT